MGASPSTHIENRSVLRDTDKAIEVEHDGEVVWFPRSHIADGGDYRRGQEGVTISFTDWILDQKGLGVMDATERAERLMKGGR